MTLTVVQFDFRPRVEGVAFHACDSIIAGIVNDAEAALGPGTDAGSAADTSLPAPPWWLIGLRALWGSRSLWRCNEGGFWIMTEEEKLQKAYFILGLGAGRPMDKVMTAQTPDYRLASRPLPN